EVLDRGGLPQLQALTLHNSTVYRWNRACYGGNTTADPVARAAAENGVHPAATRRGGAAGAAAAAARLRIGSRDLPAGARRVDEGADGAGRWGLWVAGPVGSGEIPAPRDFDEARSNFFRAANLGLSGERPWLDGRTATATELMRADVLPLAPRGLERAG